MRAKFKPTEELAAELVSAATDVGYFNVMAGIEKAMIKEALDYAGGNGALAAELLGIGRTTLVELRRRHGLPMATQRPKKVKSYPRQG